jgi:hypothetical protein
MEQFVTIAIRTRASTTDAAVGRSLVDVLSAEGMAPQQVSHNPDKINEEFNDGSLAAFWAEMATFKSMGRSRQSALTFAWRRKTVVKSSGYVRHGITNDAGTALPATVVIAAPWNKSVNWTRLFRSLLEIFPAQLGMLHLFTAPEIGKGGAWASFEAGSLGPYLSPQLPNLAWASYFGDEFAAEGNRQQLLGAGYDLEEYPNGYMVRVTPELQSLEANFEDFSRRRAELKSMYRAGLFSISDEPSGQH